MGLKLPTFSFSYSVVIVKNVVPVAACLDKVVGGGHYGQDSLYLPVAIVQKHQKDRLLLNIHITGWKLQPWPLFR